MDSRTKIERGIIQFLLERLVDENKIPETAFIQDVRRYMPEYEKTIADFSENEAINAINELLVKDKINHAPHSSDIKTWTTGLLKILFADTRAKSLSKEQKDELLRV
ncbi:MAG: hypothetical protein J6X55_17135, partial [Victivallales bacterium]|nr:hypothetical protein [Victivallales bacterium]